jgi:hypothetical protein
MGAETTLSPHNISLYKPPAFLENERAVTPSSWFVSRYPYAYYSHGSPFVELLGKNEYGQVIIPATINFDFMGSVLAGRRDLGHQVVYYLPEFQYYFKDSDGVFKVTSGDKLMVQYRSLMNRCALDMPASVNILNLVNEFTSERVSKVVLQRAKAILSTDSTFFAPDSQNQRIQGPELYERLMRVLIEKMLERAEGGCLTVTAAYSMFCRLAQQRGLGPLKRSVFKDNMKDLVHSAYGIALRHDVPDAFNRQQQAWKGLRLVETASL